MKIIGGQHRGRNLYTPKGKVIRPTTGRLRETLFDICGDIEGAFFLDLFAGAGTIGCEALSRGARHVTFVDNSKVAIELVKRNLDLIRETDHSLLVCMDVFDALKMLYKKKKKYHIIFADPPYGKDYSNKVLSFIDTHSLLEPEGRVFLEDDPKSSEEVELKNLQLLSQRKIGDTILREYK